MIEQRPSPSPRPSADRDLQPPALVDAGFTAAFSLGVLITCVSATLTGFVLFLAPPGYWLPAGIVTAGLGGLTLAFSRAEKRMREECVACGYDLRGNPEATTCPECGAAFFEPGA